MLSAATIVAVPGRHMHLSRELPTRTPPCPAAAVAALLVVQRGSPAEVDLHGCCAVHWTPSLLFTHTHARFRRKCASCWPQGVGSCSRLSVCKCTTASSPSPIKAWYGPLASSVSEEASSREGFICNLHPTEVALLPSWEHRQCARSTLSQELCMVQRAFPGGIVCRQNRMGRKVLC